MKNPKLETCQWNPEFDVTAVHTHHDRCRHPLCVERRRSERLLKALRRIETLNKYDLNLGPVIAKAARLEDE